MHRRAVPGRGGGGNGDRRRGGNAGLGGAGLAEVSYPDRRGKEGRDEGRK